MRWMFGTILAASTAVTPLMAQDHSKMDHSAHQMPAAEEAEPEVDHDKINHDQMDHGTMDHSSHQPAKPQASTPNTETGRIRAADAIWGAEAMRPSREALYAEHGNMQIFWFQGDRFEYRAREGEDGYLWDVQGYYGGDIHKFWFKSEGEGSFGEPIEDAEVQALYSRAIAPFFDLQAGIRQDLTGPTRTHAAIGVQGLVPYMFEVDAAAFLSNKGDITVRIEAEYDQRITQELILQPRAEVNLSAQDIPELGIGSGIDNLELGLRLRYQIIPEFAPYIGIEQEWKLGGSRDFARLAGEDPSVTNFVVGMRFWF
ncbi:copper resistance protein B [Parasphingorhabdus halotolerans]|uniref:Copper resistance protein B n=2 Tax=Parasphingorhabdus halotolerans TaxID=2725558 RepID=A0A6H2DRG2_9SPHN|nr:copper resistance protein B [Parasphingorhabdus halotolerans]QJB70717.1 copper resistance protein B [Parasphingorhabdus halotolerans]